MLRAAAPRPTRCGRAEREADLGDGFANHDTWQSLALKVEEIVAVSGRAGINRGVNCFICFIKQFIPGTVTV